MDDVLFLGEWSRNFVAHLLRIFDCFNLASGLKLNLSKKKIMGVGVHDQEVTEMASWIRCGVGSLPFHYLGLPIEAQMSRTSSWFPVIEKFEKKLSVWKAHNLSIRGRLTLSKAVLGSLGRLYFSLFGAPVKVTKKLESIRSIFFWGGSEEKRKIPWVEWR